MAQIVVRNIEDSVKTRLKRRAARNGRSMEEEVRAILREAVKRGQGRREEGLGTRIANRFAGIGFEEGELPRVEGEWARPAKFDE
jgi:plasmid stability protein